MAPDPVTQARVYEAIKQDLLDGFLRPRARIEIQAIAERYRSSATPIREVLNRLEGERLVEPRPEGGFRVALPSAAGLRDLYGWNSQLVLATLRLMPAAALREELKARRNREPGNRSVEQARWIASLFRSLGMATGNAECIRCIENASERLNFARLAEGNVFPDATSELSGLVRNGTLDIRRAFGRRIEAYHSRRMRLVHEILNEVSNSDLR